MGPVLPVRGPHGVAEKGVTPLSLVMTNLSPVDKHVFDFDNFVTDINVFADDNIVHNSIVSSNDNIVFDINVLVDDTYVK